MATARTDSETASKAQALREAADLGCTGAHRHPDGTWMACATMEEYEKLTASSKEKSGLDLIAETQNIREQKGNRRKRKNRRWEQLRERGVSGIDTLSGGGLVSGKGMTFRPVDGDTDVFDDINKARRRARQLGCIGVARRMSRSGRRVWTPCTNMTDYARRTGSTALGRRYQARLERQRIRGIVQEELSRARRSGRRRKTRLVEELYDIKSLGRSLRRGAAVFDPKAWDGDGDGLVQEGTPFERPSIPGINTNLPGHPKTRTKPKEYPADSQRDRTRRTEAQKPRRDPDRMRPGKRTIQRRHERQRAAGLRSVSPSKAVNASLDKTYQELVDEGHFKHPTKPHVAGKPIAVAHSAPDLARLEEIVERGWMRGESPQRRVYFFPEGHESYIDWEGDYAWDFEDPFVDAGVAAQVTPKKPITIFHEDKHGSVDAQIAKQLGISESELKSTLMEQSELVPGTSEVADTARAAKPAEGDEHRSPLNLHRAFGVDLYADYTDNEDDGGNGHSLRGHMGSEIIVMDKDIIEVVGVRETGWTEEQIASHGGRRLYRGRNWEQGRDREVFDEDKFQEWRARTNELASSGMRSQRLTRADLNERRDRTPKQNLSELGEAIDEYVAFLQEHHRHDFIRADADTISAIDRAHPGLVDEHDRLKSNVDDLGGVFEEARVDLEEMDFERDELQSELNRLVGKFDKANGESLGNQSTSQRQRRTMIRAVRDGEDKDKFLQSEFSDEMADDQGQIEWLWDTVVEERAEIMQMSKKLEELQDRISKETLGSETTLKTLRELVQGKLDEWGPKPDAPIALEPSNVALNPSAGMRSRRDALSGSNKEWLATLQANPGLWDEAPAAVRNLSSDQLRQEAMNLRSSSIQNTGGMRSGGRQKGLEILGKVKPEHRNKPSGERTLFFIGGTTGAGKSTIIKDKKVQLPDATEAAHIDPDDIKTGLRGWDPQNPGNVHHESRRVTDRVMDDAMNGGMDVVVQGTGKRDEHLREAKKRGYRTTGHFVYVPDKEADRRIAQRTADGGPNIPTYFGSLIGGELRNGIVSRQVTQGLYDEFYLWDNTGREPRLIAYRTRDGQFAVHGREEFDNFFGSSGRHVESYWQKNK